MLKIKRLFDLVISLLLIVSFSPLMILISLAIKISSPGPIIFRQKRLGENTKEFQIFKFRSMLVESEKQGTGLNSFEFDPRVTKVGKYLRSFSLDELPQLFNILRGDMSLVGPRPPVNYELGGSEDSAEVPKKFRARFTLKPGLTGLAQIKGRNSLSWEDKNDLDLEYIRKFQRYGVFIDVYILVVTAVHVLLRKNILETRRDNES